MADSDTAKDVAAIDNIGKLKKAATDGPKAVKISEAAKNDYTKAIRDFKGVITKQIDKLNGLPGYGDSGGFDSAKVAKGNLIDGCEEFKKYMGAYAEYLETAAQTVEESFKKFQGLDSH